jgi:hypothetical protein
MTGLGVIFVAALIWAAVRASRRRLTPPATGGAPPAPKPLEHESDSAAAGWLLGHELAQRRTDFPGDPLPGGHLGSARDLAFWGGVMGDDEDDDELDDE